MSFQVQDLTVPLDILFTLSPDAQLVYDLQEQKIITCNALLEELTGYHSIQLNSWGAHQQLSLIHPEDQFALAEYIETLHEPHRAQATLPLQLRVKDVHEQWLPLQASNQIIKRTETDMPWLCLVKVQLAPAQKLQALQESDDVWQANFQELQETHTQLLEKYLDMKRVNDLLESFLLNVANDLKAPISTLKLALELMNASLGTSQQPEDLHLIHSSVGKLDVLLAGLTELIRSQNHIHASSTVNFKEVLENLMPELDEELSTANGVLESDFSKCPRIQNIEPFIRIILQKLLHNAIQYAEPSRPPHIQLSTYRQGSYAVLQVKDNGRGMDLSQVSNQLFKPFTRCSTVGEGKGIGLFLVKSILESKGGSIQILSEPGRGTTVLCYINNWA